MPTGSPRRQELRRSDEAISALHLRNGGEAPRCPLPSHRLHHLVEVETDARHGLPGGAVVFLNEALHLEIVEQGDLGRLGEQGQPEAAPHSDPYTGRPYRPNRRVAAWLEVLEIAEDTDSPDRAADAGALDGIAGLGSGIETIEDRRLGLQVKAQSLKMLVPVGVLDDNLAIGIDPLQER